MTIKVYKICLFDGKRIHELYEECARKEGRIREAEKERNFHRIQIKRYGQDFKDLLEQTNTGQVKRPGKALGRS